MPDPKLTPTQQVAPSIVRSVLKSSLAALDRAEKEREYARESIIETLIEYHGSLRDAAKAIGCTPSNLCIARKNPRRNVSEKWLRKVAEQALAAFNAKEKA